MTPALGRRILDTRRQTPIPADRRREQLRPMVSAHLDPDRRRWPAL